MDLNGLKIGTRGLYLGLIIVAWLVFISKFVFDGKQTALTKIELKISTQGNRRVVITALLILQLK